MAGHRDRAAKIFVVFSLCLFFGIARSAEPLPTRLSDEAFWKLVTDFSEPGGSFTSDNFVSNELSIQDVLSHLTDSRKPGGVYMGVGPEQNFTYIAALKPRMAFIFDIRRQNLIEHLMYKALFEISTDRADFLSRLFSRPRPEDVGKDSSVRALFDALNGIPPDQTMFEENLSAIKDRLIKTHHFNLTNDDADTIGYVLRAFYLRGPNLTYNGPGFTGRSTILPNYEQLMTDTDKDGNYRSYMATEENFLALQQFEKNNMLVPLVGDFAGPTAIRSAGEYLKEHDATVAAFYTSNVEHYLFMNESWKKFYANVSMLPLDSKSVFIRPLINTGTGVYGATPLFRAGYWWETKLFSITGLVAAFNTGMIQGYYDVIGNPN